MRKTSSAYLGLSVLLLSFLTPVSPAVAATPASGFWTVAAGGERSVVFATTVVNTPVLENGGYFYFTHSKSLGFAPISTIFQYNGDVEDRYCDQVGNGELRLSWHLDGYGGYRAGCTTDLNSSSAPRAVYHSNSSASLFSGPAKNVSHQTLLDNGWSLCYDNVYSTALSTDGSDLTTPCTQTYVLLAGGNGSEGPQPSFANATPAQLAQSAQPVAGATGELLSTQPVIEVQNAQGVVITGFTGNVTVSLAEGAGGTLSGATTIAAIGGVASFSDLVISGQVGEAYVLRFTAEGFSVDSQVIRLSAQVTAPANDVVSLATPPPTPAPNVSPLVTTNPVVPRSSRILLLQGQTQPSNGPVLRNNRAPTPPSQPTANINGVPTALATQVNNSSGATFQTGQVSLGMNVQNGQGGIRQGTGGSTELEVTNGGQAALQGSGLQAGSFVQVFMPMQGNNARELARIPVDASGGFTGDILFGSLPKDTQLPIGRNVLQIVSIDDQGRQAVVEMTVNVAQPSPAPQINRVEQLLPSLKPGISLATQDGFPVPVTVRTIASEVAAVVEGSGWSMAITLGSTGEVEDTTDGARLSFVSSQAAVVTGAGFMPGTRADIWLFSDPVLLGTVIIGVDGSFQGSVNIDPNVVPVGEHTLQMQSVGVDGYILAANLGVLVEDSALVVAASEASGPSFAFLWWIMAIFVVAALVVVWIVLRHRRRA